MPNASSPCANPERITAADNAHLKQLVAQHMAMHGPHCSLNHIDVSGIENMDGVFKGSVFDGDISEWNTAEVYSAGSMFEDSVFNGDISQWDMGRLRFAVNMFKNSKFSGDISAWKFAKQGPNNVVGAFYSKHFLSDMPLLKTFGTPDQAVLHPAYQGSFRDEYTLEMATHFFYTSIALTAYLQNTASSGLHRLHIEHIVNPHAYTIKPGWCPEDAFKALREERAVGVQLGLDMADICASACQRFKENPVMNFGEPIEGSVFSAEEPTA